VSERDWLARYAAMGLAVVGALEWFLGRTVSRMASAPPLEGTAREIIETVGRAGIFLISPAFILAATLLFISVSTFGSSSTPGEPRRSGRGALALYLAVFTGLAAAQSLLSALSLFSTQPWLIITFNLLSGVAMWWVALSFSLNRQAEPPQRVAVLLIAVSYSGWLYYVLQQEAPNAGIGFEGAPVFVRDLGEIAAVASAAALFWAIAVPHGQWRHWGRWIAPLVLAMAFTAGNIADWVADQGFTGVFTTWSLGFYLFLPWPVYAVGISLFAYAVLTCFSKGEDKTPFANRNTGLGLLLLLYAGYQLQLPYQHLLALLSLLLLTGLARPLDSPVAPQVRYMSVQDRGIGA
jgi:type IV secretory pathway TrbD component